MSDDTSRRDDKQYILRSAKLPSTPPSGTRKVVTALAELAGAVSRERLATRLGVQLTGGVSRALGSAALYGFTTMDADKRLIITDRGLAFVSEDAAKAKQAEREALMSTGFGSVIKRLSTRKADAGVVALRLQEDQGIREAAALDRAKLLVKAAKEAGLVTNGNFDGGVIEDTIAVVGEPGAPKVQSNGAKTAMPKPKAAAQPPPAAPKTTTANGADGKEGGSRKEPPVPFEQAAAAAPVQIVLQIDASKLDAEQIGEIVRELRASVTVSTFAS